MARVEGFEPPTAWFVARYSIQLSYTRAKLVVGRHCQRIMAEREGFEPSIRVYAYGSLAGNWFQPLTHLSVSAGCILRIHGLESNLFYKEIVHPLPF